MTGEPFKAAVLAKYPNAYAALLGANDAKRLNANPGWIIRGGAKGYEPLTVTRRETNVEAWADAASIHCDDMRRWEQSFAYERCAGVIESSCVKVEHADELENGWWDLASAEVDLSNEVAYLDSRRLLIHHPGVHNWVTICDEGEPQSEGTYASH